LPVSPTVSHTNVDLLTDVTSLHFVPVWKYGSSHIFQVILSVLKSTTFVKSVIDVCSGYLFEISTFYWQLFFLICTCFLLSTIFIYTFFDNKRFWSWYIAKIKRVLIYYSLKRMKTVAFVTGRLFSPVFHWRNIYLFSYFLPGGFGFLKMFSDTSLCIWLIVGLNVLDSQIVVNLFFHRSLPADVHVLVGCPCLSLTCVSQSLPLQACSPACDI